MARQSTVKETGNKSGCLENYFFFDWQPVKCFEQFNVFMAALARNNFCCVFINSDTRMECVLEGLYITIIFRYQKVYRHNFSP